MRSSDNFAVSVKVRSGYAMCRSLRGGNCGTAAPEFQRYVAAGLPASGRSFALRSASLSDAGD
jgi:hypothetical protein